MNRKKKRKIEEECEQEKEKENKKRIGRKRQVTIRGVYVNKSQWILSFARHRSLLFAQKAGKLIEGDLVERRLRKGRKGERWRLRHSWSSGFSQFYFQYTAAASMKRHDACLRKMYTLHDSSVLVEAATTNSVNTMRSCLYSLYSFLKKHRISK